jgi:hypothetical protein
MDAGHVCCLIPKKKEYIRSKISKKWRSAAALKLDGPAAEPTLQLQLM